jgi:hypothetical protein
MIKTKLKRSSGNNTITSRKEINSDNGFQNRTLTGRLGSQNANSRQFNELLKSYISKFILNSRKVKNHAQKKEFEEKVHERYDELNLYEFIGFDQLTITLMNFLSC